MDSPEPPHGCACLALDPLAERLECAVNTHVLSCGPHPVFRIRGLAAFRSFLGSLPTALPPPWAPPLPDLAWTQVWHSGPLGPRMLAATLAGGAVDLTADVGSRTSRVLPGGIPHSRPLPAIARASPIAQGPRLARLGPARACEWRATGWWLGKGMAWESRVDPLAESLPRRCATWGPWVG